MSTLPLALGMAFACGVWAAMSNDAVLVTVEQRDRLRSARATRTTDVSADGRYVVFQSWARLVPADTDDRPDVYALDRDTGRVTLESDAPDDTENTNPRISGDGSFLVFEMRATHPDLLPRVDIVLRDRAAGTLRSLTAPLIPGKFGWSRYPAISEDGHVVAFSSAATELTPGTDANGHGEDVYVMDLRSGAVERASVTSNGVHPPIGTSIFPSLSANGQRVAFSSSAPLDDTDRALRPDVESRARQVYVRDTAARTTRRVSRTPRDTPPDGDSALASLSGNGRFVVFASDATNLTPNDDNRASDIFLFDIETGVTSIVSRSAGGASANGASTSPDTSADGRFVVFQSDASNLVCASRCPPALEDINLLWDTFLTDRTTGKTVRLSEDELGGWMEWSSGPSTDAQGQVVAFSSRHPIDRADTRDDLDLFVRRTPPPSKPQPR